ncbi:RHS repeat-associated core domain-containing protein [thermophilic bacterium 2918]|uniref:RHS repeat-associated core domain-containing protein n=2 Tax=Thermogemmata fonticola TaxID=2755323 RepID=A0A7V9AB72_9BACT|nr:RHS repeat-associated core domain-containing protein [Thermogemmata fonticola]
MVLRDRDSDGDGTLDDRLWVVQDANYNVTAIFDNSGNVVERYIYDPFGQATVLDTEWNVRSGGSAYDWLYLHQGGRYDVTSGLYHFRFRDYSPTLGRWTSLDPLSYAAGDVNLYRTVGNNSTNLLDPFGLEGIGHHWVPVAVLTDPEIAPWLSYDAYFMGMGAYSGAAYPPHGYKIYGGVSHYEYNIIIKKELMKLIIKNNRKPISGEQMEQFINSLINGKDYRGKIHKEIKAFNDAIMAERAAYLERNPNSRKVGQTAKDWIEQGRRYVWGTGKQRVSQSMIPPPMGSKMGNKAVIGGAIMVSAIFGYFAWEQIDQTAKAMEVAANSNNFKLAIQALQDGDAVRAERYLFGPSNAEGSYCLYRELVDKGLPYQAIVFKEWYYAKKQEIQWRLQNPIFMRPLQ